MADVVTHTPGPWKWFDYPDGRKLLSGESRAVIHCPDAPISCEAADMHLIAAAPELLAACERALSFLDADVPYGPEQPVFQQLAAAIKKARE